MSVAPGKRALWLTLSALALALLWGAVPASAHVIPRPCDGVTGGGFVINNGAHANFGLVAGCKRHHFFGHVNFIEHSLQVHVSSLTITGYTEMTPGTNRRDICGIAETNLFGEVAITWSSSTMANRVKPTALASRSRMAIC